MRQRSHPDCRAVRTQALRPKGLAKEAYQPEQYAADLSFDEAARRIDALGAEIALADSFQRDSRLPLLLQHHGPREELFWPA